MSLSSAQILTVIKALHDRVASATNVDFVFPTATRFSEKSDYWAFVDDNNDTQTEIETELINAVWISYLRFEDNDREIDGAIKTISYEITVFTEATFERLDETATPDTFNAKVSKTDHEHDTTVFSLQGLFQGITPLGLDTSIYPVNETDSLLQPESTQRLAPCAFIVDEKVLGSQTRFICEARIQLPC
jgi:hypothetical protein